jgi:glutamine synthetase
MKSLRTIALKEAQNRVSPEVKAPSNRISEFFGVNVFDKKKMKDFLSKEVYEKLVSAIDQGELINNDDANQIATAMIHTGFSL